MTEQVPIEGMNGARSAVPRSSSKEEWKFRDLGFECTPVDGHRCISRVLPGSPASERGLREGDELLSVHRTSTSVILEICRKGKKYRATIRRLATNSPAARGIPDHSTSAETTSPADRSRIEVTKMSVDVDGRFPSEDAVSRFGPSYLLPAKEKVKSNFVPPEIHRSWRVGVKFGINSNGSLLGAPKIIQSAGNRAVDKARLRAVTRSAPFSPIPFWYNATPFIALVFSY